MFLLLLLLKQILFLGVLHLLLILDLLLLVKLLLAVRLLRLPLCVLLMLPCLTLLRLPLLCEPGLLLSPVLSWGQAQGGHLLVLLVGLALPLYVTLQPP